MSLATPPAQQYTSSMANLDGLWPRSFSSEPGLWSSNDVPNRPFDSSSSRLATSTQPAPSIFADSSIHKHSATSPGGSSQAVNLELLDWFNPRYIASVLTSGIAIEDGMALHCQATSNGLDNDIIVANALISMYGKSRLLQHARALFDQAHQRTVVSWTAMITAYFQSGHYREALQLFQEMQQDGMKPNQITYTSILRTCASLEALAEGELIHMHVVNDGFESDAFLCTSLISLYTKCDALAVASLMFNRTDTRNVAMWNAIIAGYAQHQNGAEALKIFAQMQNEGIVPDRITFMSVINACASVGSLAEGMLVHGCILQIQPEVDIAIGTALIDMYGKCGALDDAYTLFEERHRQHVVSWNAMIAAYTQQGHDKESLELFKEMEKTSVLPDEVTYISTLHACANLADEIQGRLSHTSIVSIGFPSSAVLETALIHMYGNCGALHDARSVFDNMKQHDLVAWTAMLTAYTQQGQGLDALHLFQQMQGRGSVEPDQTILASTLSACGSLSALDGGNLVHACIAESGFDSDTIIANALINMYGKCGALEDAWAMFDKIKERNLVTWNAMIASYAQQGDGKGAVTLFQKMQQGGILPDKVTFVSLLCACSHAGLLEEGISLFASMIVKFGIMPSMEHYNAMVDFLGKFGVLDEGEDLVCSMPVVPDVGIWMTLLAACQVHGDHVRGLYVAEHIINVHPKSAAPYISLSTMLAADYGSEGTTEKHAQNLL